MARKIDERVADVKRYLLQGWSPSRIASQLGVSVETVVQWLSIAVGRNEILGSEVLLSIPVSVREAYNRAFESVNALTTEPTKAASKVRGWLRRNSPETSDSEIAAFLIFRGRLQGDTYHLIASLETLLHTLIEAGLKRKFGDSELGWWREGVSEKIRKECQAKRESDMLPAEHPYQYTDLVDLREILDKKWGILSERFQPNVQRNKKRLIDGILNVNRIRNRVMHSSQRRPATEKDFQELVGFYMFLFNRELPSAPFYVQ
jgi:hypothetical protein